MHKVVFSLYLLKEAIQVNRVIIIIIMHTGIFI